MKKILFAGAFAFASLAVNAQTANFENPTINYGVVKKGGDGKKAFKLTNTGDKPLLIKDVKSSCGCTVPSWTKTPIKPGETGEISVIYDTKIPGAFSKVIEVYTNDPKKGRAILKIKGEIK